MYTSMTGLPQLISNLLKGRNIPIGEFGEKLASKYLKKEGYIILERDWRFKRLQVDLITKREDVIVFVEVKTRSNDTYGRPDEFVSKDQQKRIHSAANVYLKKNNLTNYRHRFDIVSILIKENEKPLINHYEAGF